ncbi:MAG: hypothetical protein AAFV45_16175 [Pseudomonadota bacterium]
MLKKIMLAALLAICSIGAYSGAADAASCRLQGNLKSVDSGQAVSVRFVNRSGGYRVVTWLDYNGNPVDYKHLQSGQSYTQSTYVGHPWMITDGPGNCRQIFVPKRGSKRFTIKR